MNMPILVLAKHSFVIGRVTETTAIIGFVSDVEPGRSIDVWIEDEQSHQRRSDRVQLQKNELMTRQYTDLRPNTWYNVTMSGAPMRGGFRTIGGSPNTVCWGSCNEMNVSARSGPETTNVWETMYDCETTIMVGDTVYNDWITNAQYPMPKARELIAQNFVQHYFLHDEIIPNLVHGAHYYLPDDHEITDCIEDARTNNLNNYNQAYFAAWFETLGFEYALNGYDSNRRTSPLLVIDFDPPMWDPSISSAT